MDVETKNILKAISTSWYAGFSNNPLSPCVALEKSIKENQNVYRCFEGESFEKENYRRALIGMVPYFNSMSDESFVNLSQFMNYLDFNSDSELGGEMKSQNVFPSYDENQLLKRAVFLTFFSRVKPPLYSLKEIEGEKSLWKKSPWSFTEFFRR